MKHCTLSGLLLTTLFWQTSCSSGHQVATNTPRQNGVGERIVGGAEAAKGQFPWHVAILIDGVDFCNGALLDELWVLTSGHCAYTAGNFSVILGLTSFATMGENDTVTMETTLKFVHPLYDNRSLINDVALLKFETPLNLTDSPDALIAPIHLSGHVEGELDGLEVQLSGWGKTSDSSAAVSGALVFANLTVTTLADCRAAFGMANVHDGMMCTSGEEGRGACSGDEGSPLVAKSGDSWEQVGVASFAAARGCEKGAPTVYARTSVYLDWIHCTMDPENLNPEDCTDSNPGARATATTTMLPALFAAAFLWRYANAGC